MFNFFVFFVMQSVKLSYNSTYKSICHPWKEQKKKDVVNHYNKVPEKQKRRSRKRLQWTSLTKHKAYITEWGMGYKKAQFRFHKMLSVFKNNFLISKLKLSFAVTLLFDKIIE